MQSQILLIFKFLLALMNEFQLKIDYDCVWMSGTGEQFFCSHYVGPFYDLLVDGGVEVFLDEGLGKLR